MSLYDSVLARWPVPHATLTFPTRHGDTFVIVSGEASASPLVLLHGASTNSAIWKDDAVDYSRGFRVCAVDLIGEPGRSSPNRPSWEGPAYAEWLEDVLHALKINQVTLIGFSQGGWIALKFASSRPERVEKLVLLSPAGITPDKISFMIRALPLSLLGPRGIKYVNRMLLGNQSASAELEQAMTVILSNFKTRIGLVPIFTDTELQRLTMPVLLLMGAQDALRDTKGIAGRMQKLVPCLTVNVLPQGGHALLGTTPLILPFLTRTGGG